MIRPARTRSSCSSSSTHSAHIRGCVLMHSRHMLRAQLKHLSCARYFTQIPHAGRGGESSILKSEKPRQPPHKKKDIKTNV